MLFMGKDNLNTKEDEVWFYTNLGKEPSDLSCPDAGLENEKLGLRDNEPEIIKDARIYTEQLSALEKEIKNNLELLKLGEEELAEIDKKIIPAQKETAGLSGAINDFKLVIGDTLKSAGTIIAEYLGIVGENNFEPLFTKEVPNFFQYISTELRKQSPQIEELLFYRELALENEKK